MRLLLVLSVIVYCLGCGSNTKKGTMDFQEYQAHEAQEIESGERYDEIFMGFKLGMSTKEYGDRKSKLLKEGAFDYDFRKKTIFYVMGLDSVTSVPAYIETSTVNDSLLKLSLSVLDGGRHFDKIIKVYEDKYGPVQYWFRNEHAHCVMLQLKLEK